MHGYAAADVIDASALVSAAVDAAPARSASPGATATSTGCSRGHRPTDVGDFVPIPRYDDYQARAHAVAAPGRGAVRDLPGLRRSPAPHHPLGRPAGGPHAEHRPVLEAPHPPLHAPAARRRQRRGDAVDRLRRPPLDESLFGRTPITRQPQRTGSTRCAPATAAGSPPPTTLARRASTCRRGRRASTRQGSLTLPAREGDITVFGQPPGNDITDDHWTRPDDDPSPYATAEISIGRLTLTPGLRFDPVLIEGSPSLPPARRHRAARLRAPRRAPEPGPIGSHALRLAAGWTPNPRLIADVPRHASASPSPPAAASTASRPIPRT